VNCGKLMAAGISKQRGNGDGQSRRTKQREEEAEEKGSEGDVSAGEARDGL
jgi:hypothetical protein